MDRLFFKYLAPLLAISIIPTLAIVLILFFFIRNNITELQSNLIRQEAEVLARVVSEKNEAIAKTEGMYIEQEIDKIRDKLKAMQLDPDFINMNTENINAYADNLFSREPSIIELTLVNSGGVMLSQKFNSVLLESEEPVNLSNDLIFQEVERKQSYISPPEISNSTQLPFITLGEPILDNAGSFAGAIIAKLDLGFIREIVSTKKIGDSGYLFIISEKGELISHPSLREFYQNPDYSKYEHVAEILQKRNGSVWDDENLVSFFTNEYGWTTVVEIPSSEALAAAENNKRTILSFVNATLQSIAYFTVLIILFGLVIATVATVFITKRVITPILNFTNAARRISQGEFSMKIEKLSNDELGEFTDSFNKMTEELKKEREELIKSNEMVKDQAQEIIQKHLSVQPPPVSMNLSEMEKPLLRVKSYLTEIKSQKAEKFKPDQLGEIIEDVEQIDSFLKDLFEHSTILSDLSNFNPVDFNKACALVHQKLIQEIEQAGAKVHYESLPTTKALQSSIVQLFENLFTNAIKYRSEKPLEIVVSSEDKGAEWQFSVEDNGIGIDPDKFSDIFHVRDRKDERNSFSFGLALCKNIVERHGGRIWVESNKDKGSAFYFTITKFD